jgi:hypothetical protein
VAAALALASACGDGDAPPPVGAKAGALSRLDRGVGEAVSPGSLALAHAHLEGLTGCVECHAGVGGTPDEDCLACHADVGERMERRIGVHGGFEGRCASCHADHRGVDADLLGLDREAFNHERAVFPLRGAHLELECDDCHTRAHPDTGREAFHPIGIEHERCAVCHDDPHRIEFAAQRDCAACHAEAGWSARFLVPAAADGSGFLHDRDTAFPLEGAHARVACGECHTPERAEAEKVQRLAPASSAPRDCAGCHRDPHESALGAKCESCHTAAAWGGPEAIFDHARHGRFALDALHAALACESCHADARFRANGRDCESCHADAAALLAGRFGARTAAADPHTGRVDCRGCHPAELANPHLIDYERRCVECHTPEYGQLLATRTRLLDDLALRAESAVNARTRGRAAGGAAPSAADAVGAAEIRRLGRSGIHNPDLAEAALREHLRRLEADPGEGGAAWTN